MQIEQQVTSLETSKKLKELGVKQESYFWWINTAGFKPEWQLMDTVETDFSSIETKGTSWRSVGNPVSAFTVAELALIVRQLITSNNSLTEDDFCDDFDTRMDMAKVEAWALILIRCIEKGYLKTN